MAAVPISKTSFTMVASATLDTALGNKPRGDRTHTAAVAAAKPLGMILKFHDDVLSGER